MRIAGSVTSTQSVQADISPSEALSALRKEYVRSLELGEDAWVRHDKKWVETTTFYTSHSWDVEHVKREATEEEIKVWAAFDLLNKVFTDLFRKFYTKKL